MIGWWTSALQLLELFVSSVVHLGYGFYIFSSAVAGDLSQAISDLLFKPNFDARLKTEGFNQVNTNADDLPPIVLVHGIFGFGKGVSFANLAILIWSCLFIVTWDLFIAFISSIKLGFFIDLQRLGGLSYFAGAEKKDDRVLVPDLGSLTSIYDRWVFLDIAIFGFLPKLKFVVFLTFF